MEEENNELQAGTSGESGRTRVGFPQAAGEKKSRKGLVIAIILVILLLGGGAWFLFGKGGGSSSPEPTPTTFLQELTPTPVPTEIPIERSNVKVQILNGTGLTGAASSLKTQLEGLGYSDIEVGNASPQNYVKTQVSYSSDLSQDVKDEIINKLEETYEDVEMSTASSGDFDVKIITGYPKGHTPSPTTKPKATSAPTPTGGATGTVTPATTTTLTPSVSPTPAQ